MLNFLMAVNCISTSGVSARPAEGGDLQESRKRKENIVCQHCAASLACVAGVVEKRNFSVHQGYGELRFHIPGKLGGCRFRISIQCPQIRSRVERFAHAAGTSSMIGR
jgi:hypothetical protein